MIGKDWNDIVRAVHKRDRHRCQNCWREEKEVECLDVHHVVPRGRAGSHRFSNLLLLCRRCHDAAHGRCMAPRVKWTTDGEMDSLEFSLYRQYCQALEIARFDDEEECWYVPLADMRRLIESLDEEGLVQPARQSASA